MSHQVARRIIETVQYSVPYLPEVITFLDCGRPGRTLVVRDSPEGARVEEVDNVIAEDLRHKLNRKWEEGLPNDPHDPPKGFKVVQRIHDSVVLEPDKLPTVDPEEFM